MPTETKKPPTPTLEQEAQAFSNKIRETPVEQLGLPRKTSPPQRIELAASVLGGLLACGHGARAQELVEQSFKYADLLLKYKD